MDLQLLCYNHECSNISAAKTPIPVESLRGATHGSGMGKYYIGSLRRWLRDSDPEAGPWCGVHGVHMLPTACHLTTQLTR